MNTDLDWKWTAALAGGAGVASLGLLYLGYRKYNKSSQIPSRKNFARSDPVTVYIAKHNKDDDVLGELRRMSIGHKHGLMTTSIEVGKMLTMYCKALKARKVIDVGVFFGCSAVSMALGLPDDGKVIACDVSEEFTGLGKPFWQKAGVSEKIDLRLQPADKTLQELLDNGEAGSFDLVFIDADKINYVVYYELAVKLLRKGGLIVVDNALWSGRVADPEAKEEATVAIRTMNQKMRDDHRVDFVLLNICDGVGVAQKL